MLTGPLLHLFDLLYFLGRLRLSFPKVLLLLLGEPKQIVSVVRLYRAGPLVDLAADDAKRVISWIDEERVAPVHVLALQDALHV